MDKKIAIFGYFWPFSAFFGYKKLLFTVNSKITNLLTKNWTLKITDHEDNKQLIINWIIMTIFGYFWPFSTVVGYIKLLFTVHSKITNLLTKNYALKITNLKNNKQLNIYLVDTLAILRLTLTLEFTVKASCAQPNLATNHNY